MFYSQDNNIFGIAPKTGFNWKNVKEICKYGGEVVLVLESTDMV